MNASHALLLAALLVAGCGESPPLHLYLVPEGYVGPVVVAFGREDGAPGVMSGYTRVYTIPQSGVLLTSDPIPLDPFTFALEFVDRDGRRSPIDPGIQGTDPPGKVVWFAIHQMWTNKGTTGLGFCSVLVGTFEDEDRLRAQRDSVDESISNETSRVATGLTEAQALRLERFGVPLIVPLLPLGWALAEPAGVTIADGPSASPAYTIRYTTPSGACVTLEAASGDASGAFAEDPPNEREVEVKYMTGPVRLGWGASGERAGAWAGGRVATDWFGFGLHDRLLRLDTGTGTRCPPASPDDVEDLLYSFYELSLVL